MYLPYKVARETAVNYTCVLLDTGCSDSILSKIYLNLYYSINKAKYMYYMANNLYKANKHGTNNFKLSESSSSKNTTWSIETGELCELEHDIII